MSLQLNSLPDSMSRVYLESLNHGNEAYALRQCQLEGWYEHAGVWKQIAPNVRSKVNVRKAHKQPDGRFLITDVPVFYPNSVKASADGTEDFTPDRVRTIIANTNRAIIAGGQRPGLVAGHPGRIVTKTVKSGPDGVAVLSEQVSPAEPQQPAYGHGVNFREMPNKPGWAMCDLVDVESGFMEDGMKQRMSGLSAGLVGDARGLNERIGHIARLGAESQALAYLPTTEIFSANYLAFSADSATFAARPHFQQGKTMAKKSECFSKMAAAYAAKEVGEPGWESKVDEAEKDYKAFESEVDDTPQTDMGALPTVPDSTMTKVDDASKEPAGAIDKKTDMATQCPGGVDEPKAEPVPTGPNIPLNPTFSAPGVTQVHTFSVADVAGGSKDFAAQITAQFNTQFTALRQEIDGVRKTNQQLKSERDKALAESAAADRRAEWSRKINDFASKRDFNASEYLEQFSAYDGQPKLQSTLFDLLGRYPAKLQPAAGVKIFDMTEATYPYQNGAASFNAGPSAVPAHNPNYSNTNFSASSSRQDTVFIDPKHQALLDKMPG